MATVRSLFDGPFKQGTAKVRDTRDLDPINDWVCVERCFMEGGRDTAGGYTEGMV